MTDLISIVAAAIQKRSVARLGTALSSEACVDFASAAIAETNAYQERGLGPKGMLELRRLLQRVPFDHDRAKNGADT